MIDEKALAEAYQPLFDFMANEYGKTLIRSEMDEIISVVDKVNENLVELWRIKCDIIGCDKTASTQGIYYADCGYWSLCSHHSQMARDTKQIPTPPFKPESIYREELRRWDKNPPTNQ